MKAKHALWGAGLVGLVLLLGRRGAGWGKRGSGEGWGASPERGGKDEGGPDEGGKGYQEDGDGGDEAVITVTPDPDAGPPRLSSGSNAGDLLVVATVVLSSLQASVATAERVEDEVRTHTAAMRRAIESCEGAPRLVGSPSVSARGEGRTWGVAVRWPAKWPDDAPPPAACIKNLKGLPPSVAVQSVRRVDTRGS